MHEQSDSALERLNRQFYERQQSSVKTVKKKKIRSQKVRYTILFVGSMICIAAVAMGFLIVKNKGDSENSAQTTEDQILTEEEKQEWEMTPVDDTGVFLDVITRWELEPGEKTIFLRLVNPPYSAYPLKVEIYLENAPQDILYSSKLLKPGEYITYAELKKTVEAGSHEAILHYYFYRDEKMEYLLGQYEVKGLFYSTQLQED